MLHRLVLTRLHGGLSGFTEVERTRERLSLSGGQVGHVGHGGSERIVDPSLHLADPVGRLTPGREVPGECFAQRVRGQRQQILTGRIIHGICLYRLRPGLNLAADRKSPKARRTTEIERSASERLANRLRAWGPAATWATVLFLLSAWSDPMLPAWVSAHDKLAHFGLYAVFGVALGYGRHYDVSSPPHVLPLLAGGTYGATDEWHQALVVGRTPGWGDWIADMAGVSFGYVLALFILTRVAPVASATSGVDVAD